MVQGLEKLLFIQMWLAPHHFKLAVLITPMVLFAFYFFPPNLQPTCAPALRRMYWTKIKLLHNDGALHRKVLPQGAPKKQGTNSESRTRARCSDRSAPGCGGAPQAPGTLKPAFGGRGEIPRAAYYLPSPHVMRKAKCYVSLTVA